LLKGRKREQSRVQVGVGRFPGGKGYSGAFDHNQDDHYDNNPPLRLHQGRKRQQGCVPYGERTNTDRSLAWRGGEHDKDDLHDHGLRQMVQPAPVCLSD
jgi:hypothetical protein